MPPKKKQQKPTGFTVFMWEKRKEFERNGEKFPNGLADVQPKCAPLWMQLSPEEKAAYNQKAKSCPQGNMEKYDSRGVPISWREKEELKKATEKIEITQKVETMVSSLKSMGELQSHFFFLAHFNYAVETQEKEYPPCEIAIVKFSLLDGISKVYHQFVNPGNIKLGYAFHAVEHAKETHKIPATGFKLYNSNYIEITDGIKSLLKQADGGIAPVFVLDEEIPVAIYVFNWLIERCLGMDPNYDPSNSFKAYSLNKLLYELRRHANLDNPTLRFTSTTQVGEALRNEKFVYEAKMPCQWHEEEDNVKFCSLTIVRNYAFMICDYCCEVYELSFLPDRHIPARLADERAWKTLPKDEERETPGVKRDCQGLPVEVVPRMPNSFAKVIESATETAGSLTIGSANAVSVGKGRGLLGASISTNSPNGVLSSDNPPPARGRGRGTRLLSDD